MPTNKNSWVQTTSVFWKKTPSGWWWQLKDFFIFIPIWGRFPIWRACFSNGLVQPPTRLPFCRRWFSWALLSFKGFFRNPWNPWGFVTRSFVKSMLFYWWLCLRQLTVEKQHVWETFAGSWNLFFRVKLKKQSKFTNRHSRSSKSFLI